MHVGTEYADTYAYDLSDNRVSKTHDAAAAAGDMTTLSVYNARDQLLRSGADANANGTLEPAEATESHGYDASGSTTSVTTPAGVKRYVWDLRNRMSGFDANGDNDTADPGDATFRYDHNGVRTQKRVWVDDNADGTADRETVTSFLQDTNNPTGYSQVLEERLDGVWDRSYVIGQDVITQADGQPYADRPRCRRPARPSPSGQVGHNPPSLRLAFYGCRE